MLPGGHGEVAWGVARPARILRSAPAGAAPHPQKSYPQCRRGLEGRAGQCRTDEWPQRRRESFIEAVRGLTCGLECDVSTTSNPNKSIRRGVGIMATKG